MLTLLFLIGLVVLAIVAIVLTEVEHFGLATLTLIVGVVGAQLLHVANILHYVEHHAVQSLLYVLVYLVVGVVWSFVKWFSYLMGFRDKYREYKEKFLTERNLDPAGAVPEDKLLAFKEFLLQQARYNDRHLYAIHQLEKPRASRNKSRIIAWMSLWPFSVVGTVLNDPVRRLFNFLFNQFKALYQKLADQVFAKDVELK